MVATTEAPKKMKVGAITIPLPNMEDPAELASFFSGFSYEERWRKVVLATCRELIRAEYAAKGIKISEARIDDLARMHHCYLEFLERMLRGRTAWEREVQQERAGGFGR